jgi:hypothetical protein
VKFRELIQLFLDLCPTVSVHHYQRLLSVIQEYQIDA